MATRRSIVEHAFILARSGKYDRVEAIRLALRQEGFSIAEVMGSLGGKGIAQQLRDLCRDALLNRELVDLGERSDGDGYERREWPGEIIEVAPPVKS